MGKGFLTHIQEWGRGKISKGKFVIFSFEEKLSRYLLLELHDKAIEPNTFVIDEAQIFFVNG